jgi:hypothetical protein
VIDRGRVVGASYVSAHYGTRMEPADSIAALDQLTT